MTNLGCLQNDRSLCATELDGHLCRSVALSVDLKKTDLARFVERMPSGLCSTDEYVMVGETLLEKAPSNVLVFGLGHDSHLWACCNGGGTTLFLEDVPYWIRHITGRYPHIVARHVSYGTVMKNWRVMLRDPARLRMELPRDVRATKWDVIIVDGPKGWKPGDPGRMKSIYAAYDLSSVSRRPVDLFFHDCDREVECAYIKEYFRRAVPIAVRQRMAHYRTKPPLT